MLITLPVLLPALLEEIAEIAELALMGITIAVFESTTEVEMSST